MKVIVAKRGGFCWGVKRAVYIVDETIKKNKNQPIFTYGPLIHNTEVVEHYKKKGVLPEDDVNKIHEGTIVVRAHGIPPSKKKLLEEKGIKIVDATCPHVSHSQLLVEKLSNEGFDIVIAGDKNHAEVIGLTGFVKTKYYVISNEQEASNLRLEGKTAVIAQSTFSEVEYKSIIDALKKFNSDIQVCDTLCNAVSNSQKELSELADNVDAVVIIGSRKSANTTRLAMISRWKGKPTYHIENESELNFNELTKYNIVGVTAGASTPDFVIEKVVRKLESMS